MQTGPQTELKEQSSSTMAESSSLTNTPEDACRKREEERFEFQTAPPVSPFGCPTLSPSIRLQFSVAQPQVQHPLGKEKSGEEKDMPPQLPPVRKGYSEFLKSFFAVTRILQILLGAVLWGTIAANKYEGSIHFVLFVAVFFWLLTMALFFLTLLGKQDLVPLVGGDRWLITNAVHDLAATLLYLAATGVMASKTQEKTFCTLEHYKHPCPYKVYLTASIFCGLCAAVYLVSAVYNFCRKCRGEQTVV
ncbi:MARVEL domain-containing protein 1-like [Arapaima gigas]